MFLYIYIFNLLFLIIILLFRFLYTAAQIDVTFNDVVINEYFSDTKINFFEVDMYNLIKPCKYLIFNIYIYIYIYIYVNWLNNYVIYKLIVVMTLNNVTVSAFSNIESKKNIYIFILV